MTTTTIEPMSMPSDTDQDAATQLVPIEEAVRRAFVALRERQARAARLTGAEHPHDWIAASLERRPLRIVIAVGAEETDVWLLDPAQEEGAEVGLYVNVYHPAGDPERPDHSWATGTLHTKAFADLLTAIDWVAKDTLIAPQV